MHVTRITECALEGWRSGDSGVCKKAFQVFGDNRKEICVGGLALGYKSGSRCSRNPGTSQSHSLGVRILG